MVNEKRLIDANALKQKFDEREADDIEMYGCHIVECFPADDAKEVVDEASTVDAVEVVHGRWVGSGKWNHKPYRMKNKEKWQTYLCSECGHSNGRRFNDKYCPNCGAKMDGG